jgi:GGDEF domain-containing protein
VIFSLLAVYRAPLEQVIDVWKAAFDLREGPNATSDDAWHEFALPGVTSFLTFRRPAGYDSVWVEAHSSQSQSYEPAEQLFFDILALPLKATEVILLDDDYIGGPIVTNHWQDEPVREIVEEFERQFHCREHSLRAFRLDTLRDPDEWEGQAKEFGLGWRQGDAFAILDVQWHLRGRKEDVFDSLASLPLQHVTMPGLKEAMEDFAVGTLFLLRLCNVAPNPERSPEPWRQALEEVANALQTCLGPRDSLARLDYPRQFALLCPGLAHGDAAAGLRNIGRVVSQTRPQKGGFSIAAQAYSLSWPEDGDTLEAIAAKLQAAFDESPPGTTLAL